MTRHGMCGQNTDLPITPSTPRSQKSFMIIQERANQNTFLILYSRSLFQAVSFSGVLNVYLSFPLGRQLEIPPNMANL